MARPLRIRAATRADLDHIVDIERAVFSDPWPVSAFTPLLELDALVAEVGGDIAGYLFARSAADEAEVLNLAVRVDSRRGGIGRRLLGHLLAGLALRGITRVFLEVRVSNTPAQAFYRSLGFGQVGVRRGYYTRPVEDALILARDISPSGDAK